MDVKTFATLLAKSLIKRGIDREVAVKHSVSLVRTFDEEDLSEIASYTAEWDFEDLSDSLAQLIKDKEGAKRPVKDARTYRPHASTRGTPIIREDETKVIPAVRDDATRVIPAVKDDATRVIPAVKDDATRVIPAVKDDATRVIPAVRDDATRTMPAVSDDATRTIPAQGGSSESMKTKAYQVENGELTPSTKGFDALKTSDISIPSDDEDQEIYLDEGEGTARKVTLTKRGKAFFWGIAVITSPVTLLISALVLLVFAMGIAAVCALIAAVFVLVCAEAVAGGGLTLVGIIYGAIEIVGGSMGAGIYEMGLGICCGGVALALGVLTYYIATVALPYALKQLIAFEGYCLKRVGPMLDRFREECNRL